MRNDYEVRDDHVAIFLNRRDGSRLETKVSIRHLQKLKDTDVRFFASWDKGTKSFYAVYHFLTDNGVDSIRSLHRLIMGFPEDGIVDHWDKDTLNNLDSNLNIVTHSQNLQNRNDLHPRNTTGFMGVSYCKRTGRYYSQIVINKKHHWLGRYDTPEEAHEAYIRYRDNSKIYINTEVRKNG